MMRHFVIVFLLGLLWLPVVANAQTYWAKYAEDKRGQRILLDQGFRHDQVKRLHKSGLYEMSYPQVIQEHAPLSSDNIVEVFGDRHVVEALLRQRKVQPGRHLKSFVLDEDIELRTLVQSGPSANRIDLVFMGDGYTEQEREQFFSDMERLTQDMFTGDTFASYLPLFNVHAIFLASAESGIGAHNRPKNTAYGLYREGNTLRAIFMSKPEVARAVCRKAPGCDYPIVIANDPYYGGLGGEFAISTSSVTSGTVVLRHELGHNFGRVGEEYDGGGYFGANYSSSLNSLGWRHWLTTPDEVKEEPMMSHYVGWPWQNLRDRDFVIQFTSSGHQTAAAIEFSLSGLNSSEDIQVHLDDNKVSFQSATNTDRNFYTVMYEPGFSAGTHALRFHEGVHDGNNWLSSLSVYEYGAGFHFDPHYVGAYPNFNELGRVVGYRATHKSCLMRQMKYRHFCPVCQENNWLKFFARISLIDGIDFTEMDDKVRVNVKTPALGQLRKNPHFADYLSFRWYRNGQLEDVFNDQSQIDLDPSDLRDLWEVEVQFLTPEVRHDPEKLLIDRETIRF